MKVTLAVPGQMVNEVKDEDRRVSSLECGVGRRFGSIKSKAAIHAAVQNHEACSIKDRGWTDSIIDPLSSIINPRISMEAEPSAIRTAVWERAELPAPIPPWEPIWNPAPAIALLPR